MCIRDSFGSGFLVRLYSVELCVGDLVNGGFARRQLVFAVLLDRKVVRVAGFQLVEHDIHRVLEGLIVLSP